MHIYMYAFSSRGRWSWKKLKKKRELCCHDLDKIQAERKKERKKTSRIRGTSGGNRSLKNAIWTRENEETEVAKRNKSPSFSPLFQTKLDPSQISPTDRTDHPFLPSSFLLHLLGATPTSDVATSEISFERTSRDARTKRYSNSSTLSLPPDDTIFQFWFTT